MSTHWEQEHPEKLQKIQEWLGESVDAKLREAKRIAKEGMKGASAGSQG